MSAVESRDQEVIWYARRGEVKSIDAFLSIAEALSDVKFTVIGEVSSPSVRLPDNVSYLGWLAEPERAIARHRVLLNTSPVEGMPNTALQALAAGLRVVAFDNAGIRELATNYPGYVHFVRGGDVSGMSALLKTVLGLPVGDAQDVPTVEDVVEAWQSLLGGRGD
ncbi:glycosyltransferase family 4 protein [Georgenia satyanarayanai]|uniref:glycosyltransferase family 4 protein n=1 Tax=Georgenia satyanarayanai TaxID=860221 RepID=UPI00203E8010|nr:glycosyltransferase family 4 protein [Georgenia satyanarayanai]MCM3661322.1 glycosyltransferase family 4 protein [Georgenia satyanarayanai]